jgi:hypothetical protein
MQQSCGVNELDEGGRLDAAHADRVAGAARQHDQQRAQAFAAATDDVFRDLVDQGYGTAKAAADGLVDGLQLGANQGANALERLAAAVIATQLFVSPTECAV